MRLGWNALGVILTDIKLSHSLFALPFAVIGLLVGTRGELPDFALGAKFVGAMILARCAAMAFNRLVDHRFDATNPRTRDRALPAGRVSRGAVMTFVALTAAGFMAVAASLGPLCLALSPAVLAILFLYSLTKRFTVQAHVFVGLALALSPPAAYLAARGSVEADVVPILWLAAAVLCWVAGFDIIYACQDVDHDRRERLHALPARWGPRRALSVARALHAAMILALIAAAATLDAGPLSWWGVGLVALLLLVEHRLVAWGRMHAAFFTVNGLVSLVFSVFVSADLLWP